MSTEPVALGALEFEAILLEEATRLANQCLDAAEAIRDRWPMASRILAQTAETARREIARRAAAGYGAASKLGTNEAAGSSIDGVRGNVIPLRRP